MRPILVGENNPYGADPEYALYPQPPHSAGGRFCRKVMGMVPIRYLKTFDRRNLLQAPRWSVPAARHAANSMFLDAVAAKTPLILLGAKVTAAFGYEFLPFTDFEDEVPILILPHPSGLSRAWNEPGAYERAREAVLKLISQCATPEPLNSDGLPRTEWSTNRPARCSNCGIVAMTQDCPDCGPMS